jgi:hypothetical protein
VAEERFPYRLPLLHKQGTFTLRREAAAVKKTSEGHPQSQEAKRPNRAELRKIGELLLKINGTEGQLNYLEQANKTVGMTGLSF